MAEKWKRTAEADALLEKLELETAASILRLPTDAADDAKRLKRVEETRVGALGQPDAIMQTLDAIRKPAERLAATAQEPSAQAHLSHRGGGLVVCRRRCSVVV